MACGTLEGSLQRNLPADLALLTCQVASNLSSSSCPAIYRAAEDVGKEMLRVIDVHLLWAVEADCAAKACLLQGLLCLHFRVGLGMPMQVSEVRGFMSNVCPNVVKAAK